MTYTNSKPLASGWLKRQMEQAAKDYEELPGWMKEALERDWPSKGGEYD